MTSQTGAVHDSLPHKGLGHKIDVIFSSLAGLALIAMLAHVVINAVLRSVLNMPISYSNEMIQYWYMPVLVVMGFVVAQARGQHIMADLFFSRLPLYLQRWVASINYALAAILCASLCWFSYFEADHAQSIGREAGLSGIPAWPVVYLLPICFAVMTLQFLYAALSAFRGDILSSDDAFDNEVSEALTPESNEMDSRL